ncbi:MAG: HlyC/CorC family transporter [Chloroflexi bacterium]|nr:HlyC/CorC family transporter [Chloroflexota bacterium]
MADAPTPTLRRLILRYERTGLLIATVRFALLLALSVSLTSWVVSQTWARWYYLVLLALLVLFIVAALHVAAHALGRSHARAMLQAGAPLLNVLGWVFIPILWLSERLGLYAVAWRSDGEPEKKSSAGNGAEEDEEEDIPMEEEVRGADPEERRMIEAILELEDIPARQVMVPRVDIVAVGADTSLAEVAAIMADEGHSRLPVYGESIDAILGIVYARDVLHSIVEEGSNAAIRDIIRPALFIPEGKPLDELLKEMQAQRVSIAIVVDEYGGTEGLLTIEDLLEEIVGDIDDEFQKGEPVVVHIQDGEAVVDGRIQLEDLNDALDVDLEGDEGFDTLGGLISHRLGRIPASGDAVTDKSLTLHVLSTIGRRVGKVRVTKTPPGPVPPVQ